MSTHVTKLQEVFGDGILSQHEFRGEQTVVVALAQLKEVMAYCKDSLGFDFLIDICSVDHESVHPRFEVVYELASVDDSQHLRVKAPVAEDEDVPTVIDLWKTADWHEREVYDMMGIKFSDHPNLKRILMWEGYPYHPLRKEFPLAGKPTEMPDVAFTGVAPMEGGPFVTSSSAKDTVAGEPRAKGES
ncbi:NADH-quinone oxidoreductase subunit C [Rubritalea tangerina]|uniref:NADH-quinone oxidoreductase subunit C n=1 Tax=Rubritalea tangerina TaxID=430798 RepID=A0ABW4ZCZ2_9BACT